MVDSCLAVHAKNFANLAYFVSLVSVQLYIQIVPLCYYNNNKRKQVYMAFEHGLLNK